MSFVSLIDKINLSIFVLVSFLVKQLCLVPQIFLLKLECETKLYIITESFVFLNILKYFRCKNDVKNMTNTQNEH